MAQGLESYKFGSKNNWRRRIWNEAIKRLKASGLKISEAKAIYLAGPENLDQKIAIEKGFKPWNLFAVEIEKDTVEKLRNNKKNVLSADINDIVQCFDLKVDFIFADFCGGLSRNSHRLIYNILDSFCIHNGTVIAVNMLRGRESKIDSYLNNNFKPYDDLVKYHKINKKHRGLQFFNLMNGLITYALDQYYDDDFPNEPKSFLINDSWKLLVDSYFTNFKPRFYSYKSLCNDTALYMDSVIFQCSYISKIREYINKFKNVHHGNFKLITYLKLLCFDDLKDKNMKVAMTEIAKKDNNSKSNKSLKLFHLLSETNKIIYESKTKKQIKNKISAHRAINTMKMKTLSW